MQLDILLDRLRQAKSGVCRTHCPLFLSLWRCFECKKATLLNAAAAAPGISVADLTC